MAATPIPTSLANGMRPDFLETEVALRVFEGVFREGRVEEVEMSGLVREPKKSHRALKTAKPDRKFQNDDIDTFFGMTPLI